MYRYAHIVLTICCKPQRLAPHSRRSRSPPAAPPQHDQAPEAVATLHGCLRHLVAPERLGAPPGASSDSGGWVCGSCQRRQAAVKQLSIRRLPPVLTLHVKRFEHRHHGHHHAHGGHAGAAGACNGLVGMEAGVHAGGGRAGRPHGGGRHHASRKVQVRRLG